MSINLIIDSECFSRKEYEELTESFENAIDINSNNYQDIINTICHKDNVFVLISNFNKGCVNYHEAFFASITKKSIVKICYIGEEEISIKKQIDANLRKHKYEILNYAEVIFLVKNKKEILEITRQTNKPQFDLLVFSKRESCGKKSLCNLIQEYDSSLSVKIYDSNNPQIIQANDGFLLLIVGNDIDDFSVKLPIGINAFWILTKSDEIPEYCLNEDYAKAKIKKKIIETNQFNYDVLPQIFITSPLYESFRKADNNPNNDSRFAEFDSFGLPVELSPNNDCKAFLDKFNQINTLTDLIKKEVGE